MSKRSSRGLANSFRCALRGVVRSAMQERNLRIHFFAAAYVLYFSRYYAFSGLEYAVVLLTIGLVIACELVNTAIESAVDLAEPDYSALAKSAKDAAAGAVLVSSGVALAVGFALFWQIEILRQILGDVLRTPLVWFFLVVITAFLVAWPERRQKALNKE